MAKACWKQFERYIASIFQTTRTPLSGGNGKVTRSDTFHPSIFLSMKYTQSNHIGLRKLVAEEREKAKVEKKTAICVIGQAGDRSNALVVIHLKDFPQLCQDIRDGKIQASLESDS